MALEFPRITFSSIFQHTRMADQTNKCNLIASTTYFDFLILREWCDFEFRCKTVQVQLSTEEPNGENGGRSTHPYKCVCIGLVQYDRNTVAV